MDFRGIENSVELPTTRADIAYCLSQRLHGRLLRSLVERMDRLRELQVGEVSELEALAAPFPGRDVHEALELLADDRRLEFVRHRAGDPIDPCLPSLLA